MTVRICAREGCETPLPPGSAAQRRFCGHSCQQYQWRTGEKPTSKQHPLEEVVTKWAALHSRGTSRVEAAEALGISYAALTKALARARAVGDPRVGGTHA